MRNINLKRLKITKSHLILKVEYNWSTDERRQTNTQVNINITFEHHLGETTKVSKWKKPLIPINKIGVHEGDSPGFFP